MGITSATYRGKVQVVELPSGPGIAANSVVNHTVFSQGFGTENDVVLNASSTPAVSMVADFQKALSSGAGTIDLTAVPGVSGTQDMTGKKIVMAKFRNPSTNANPITVKFGATNGYLLLGTGWQITLSPGQEITFGPQAAVAASTPSVSSTTKTIDLSGTGSQALDVILVAG